MEKRFSIDTIMINGTQCYKVTDFKTGDVIYCKQHQLNDIIHRRV
jgi:hypothetical protein